MARFQPPKDMTNIKSRTVLLILMIPLALLVLDKNTAAGRTLCMSFQDKMLLTLLIVLQLNKHVSCIQLATAQIQMKKARCDT